MYCYKQCEFSTPLSSPQYPTHRILLWQNYLKHIKPLVNCIVLKQCAMLKHTLAKEEKKKDCTVHYIPISKKWYNFLWFDCPYVWVYVSQYNMVFSLHLLSVSADTKAFQVPIGHFGIYIAFPLLRFQALLGIERIFRWVRFRKKWWRTKYCWNLKNMSSLLFFPPSVSSVLKPCEG